MLIIAVSHVKVRISIYFRTTFEVNSNSKCERPLDQFPAYDSFSFSAYIKLTKARTDQDQCKTYENHENLRNLFENNENH